MADVNRFPQIPGTVWWGVRSILQKTPNITLDERLLGSQLNVQETAARQYVAELKAAGIISEDCKPTAVALKWRLDEKYSEAVADLTEANYPEGLRQVAELNNRDRQKIAGWFLQEGLGQGAAGNKAATFLLISSDQPGEAPNRSGASRNLKRDSGAPPRDGKKRSKGATAGGGPVRQLDEVRDHSTISPKIPDIMPLNINIQIHIGADAGSEQIDSIFSAMRRYLYDVKDN